MPLPLPKARLEPEPPPKKKEKAPPKPIVQVPPPPPPATEEEQAEIKQAAPAQSPEPKTAEEARAIGKKPQQKTRFQQVIEAQAELASKAPEGEKPIPPVFQPVDYFQALASANPTLAFVMLRQLKDMEGPMPNTANGSLAVLSKLQRAITSGEDITGLNPEITVHVTGQSERNELIFALLDALDMERMVELLNNRAKFEDFMSSCARRSDLNINEAMAIAAYTRSELESIYAKLRPKQSARVEGVTMREPSELVTRANLPTQLQRKELQQKFNEASPQEREILRKLGFKVQQGLKITKTQTTTETVEIVQQQDGTGTVNAAG